MDHISYYSCGESDSGVEFAGESDTPTSVCDDSSGGNPGNTVSGNCKTVIAGDSDVEGINVSYRAFTPAHDDGKPRPQMTAMPILDCTPSDDPESSTTATTTTDEVASSTQPRECQTRSLTQLFHLTATLNEHFRLSITRMEKKLDEVVRKVSEMEEAMQEWKEGHKNSEKGEEEDEKNEEEKEVVEEEKESLSEDEGHRVHSWEKWLPRTRQMKDCIDQNKAGNDTKRNKEVNETKTENEENNTEFAQSIYDTPAPASTENSVGDNLESDQGAQSKSVKDTFLLNESEKKEIKHLHDVTTHTHGVAMTTAKEVQQQPPRPIETYHINQDRTLSSPAVCKIFVTTKRFKWKVDMTMVS